MLEIRFIKDSSAVTTATFSGSCAPGDYENVVPMNQLQNAIALFTDNEARSLSGWLNIMKRFLPMMGFYATTPLKMKLVETKDIVVKDEYTSKAYKKIISEANKQMKKNLAEKIKREAEEKKSHKMHQKRSKITHWGEDD